MTEFSDLLIKGEARAEVNKPLNNYYNQLVVLNKGKLQAADHSVEEVNNEPDTCPVVDI